MFSEFSFLAAGDTDDFAVPLSPTVDAGGPYIGDLGVGIQLAGTYQPNSGTDIVLTWSANIVGTFDDNHILNPIFTPGVNGENFILTLTITTSNASPVFDNADLTVNYLSQAIALSPTSTLGNTGAGTPLSSKITVAGWYRNPDPTYGVFRILRYWPLGPISDTKTSLDIQITPAIGMRFHIRELTNVSLSGGEVQIDIPTSTVKTTQKWTHFIFSIDSSTGTVHAAINGVEMTGGNINIQRNTIGDYDFLRTYYMQIPNADGQIGETLDADFADIYIHPDYYVDLSVPANISKFINGSGSGATPKYLGIDGSDPSGEAPPGYFIGDKSGFLVNRGTKSNLQVNSGSITDSTKEPVVVP